MNKNLLYPEGLPWNKPDDFALAATTGALDLIVGVSLARVQQTERLAQRAGVDQVLLSLTTKRGLDIFHKWIKTAETNLPQDSSNVLVAQGQPGA